VQPPLPPAWIRTIAASSRRSRFGGQPVDKVSAVISVRYPQTLFPGGQTMAQGKWDAFGDIATLQDRINRLFEDAFPRTGDVESAHLFDWRPVVDIYKTGEGIVIQIELPGVKKEDISVEVKDDVLTIKGERRRSTPARPADFYRRERLFGTFGRSFNLQYPVNPENIKARFKDGVLEVELPLPEPEKPRQVTVGIE
jgi:HSP20 family protein